MKKQTRQKAVAIKYNPDELAPKILAKGAGTIAEKILENAEKSEITIHKDEALTEALTHMELGQFIPPELYQAIAQILVFINNLDRDEQRRL
jgi:flagellar biosynthesis protein